MGNGIVTIGKNNCCYNQQLYKMEAVVKNKRSIEKFTEWK